MTVQEFFKTLNVDDIVDAYMFRYGINEDSIEASNHTLGENFLARRKERELIKKFVTDLLIHPIIQNDNCVLFVMPFKDIFWEDRNKIRYDASVVHLEDLQDDKNNLHGYAFEFSPIEEILGYRLAEVSRVRLNPYDITSEILNELTFFGMDIESRNIRADEEKEELLRRAEEVDKHKDDKNYFIPAENVFSELRNSLFSSIEDDDEKEYFLLEEEFDKQTKAIKDRYAKKILEEQQKITDDYYNAEFFLRSVHD